MTARSVRKLGLAGAAAWSVVGLSGAASLVANEGDAWEAPYTVFATALLVAAAFTVIALTGMTAGAHRRRLRACGLTVSALGVVASVVAWALLLWMTLFAAGFAVLAASSPVRVRRMVALLAAAQGVGIVTQCSGLGLGVGQDTAADFALIVASALMVCGLVPVFGTASLDDATAPRGVVASEG